MPEVNIAERLSALEYRMSSEVASRSWVHEVLVPIRDSVLRQEMTIASLSEDTKNLYTAHDQLLKERAMREREEHEERMKALQDRTFTAMLKNHWVPVFGFIIATCTILTIIGGFVSWYLNHVFK